MKKISAQKGTVLVMDDEPQFLDWLFEYLKERGYDIESASDLGVAMQKLGEKSYRAVIADLSVPIPPEMLPAVEQEGKVYLEYPGLYVAHQARNRGYRDRQVVVYSVHDSAAVADLAKRIRVCYITKGRPRMLKAELDAILSFDPTATENR